MLGSLFDASPGQMTRSKTVLSSNLTSPFAGRAAKRRWLECKKTYIAVPERRINHEYRCAKQL
jgi:hypothetical protein